MTRRRAWRWAVGLALAVAIGLQLVPFGHPRTNPAATSSVEWPDDTTRRLFFRACADCHSNETRWPWYSAVAPASWVVTGDVRHGRGTLNVSEWSVERFGEEAREAGTAVREGSMPPEKYLRLHPEARLSETERARLICGLVATFGTSDPALEAC